MNLEKILELFPTPKKITGKNEYTTYCPAHEDKKRSLSIGYDNGKILLKCFAGCTCEQILQAINLNPSDLFENTQFKQKSIVAKQQYCTVEELAQRKKISPIFLARLGIKNKNGNGVIEIPYWDQNGQKTIKQRIRKGISASDSAWEMSDMPVSLYGLWLQMNNAPELIICEGESNCWTLWLHDFPALGVPGANMFNKIQLCHLANTKKIYILKDPDQGGETMANGIPKHLKSIGWNGQINTITLPVKDISDFYCQDTENFRERFSKILSDSDKANCLANEIKVLPFPIESFPPLFSSYVKNIASNLSTSLDYSAVSLLGLISVLSGKTTITVQKKDWKTKAILYLALIGNPGSAKTPAMEKTLAALYDLEEGFRDENIKTANEYKEEQEKYKVEFSAWKREQKRGEATEAPEPPAEPSQKTLLTTDATTESLAPLLDNNEGMLLMKDELSSWISSMDQYRAGKGADKEFYLSAWSGTFAKIDRKGKPSIFIRSPHLSIMGGIVPDKLSLLSGNANDGFFDRLLCCYPDPVEHVWDTEPIDSLTRKRAKDKLKEIYYADCGFDIIVDIDAEATFGEYYNECNKKEGDFWSKMPQHCLRIALCLCLLWEKRTCDVDIMKKAIDIAKYFEKHNEKARGKSKETESTKQRNAIIDFAKRKGITRFKPRTLQISRVPGCDSAKNAKQQMQELVDLELAFWITEGKEIELLPLN